MKLILILTTVLLLNLNAYAQDVSLQYKGLTLNANLEKTSNWSTGPVVLMTHGTLAHNKMEIMSTLQNLLKDQGVSSLAINLSLGLDNRQGFYDCTVPHSHKHEDAVNEIGLWLNWLQQQGVKQVVLLGHSRGGNQTAWYATEHDSPLIKKIILIAPQTWSMTEATQGYKKNYNKDLLPILNKARSLVNKNQTRTMLDNTDFIYCKDTSVSAESFVSYYKKDPRKNTPHLLKRISKPVMVFIGSEDPTTRGLDQTIQNIHASNVSTTTIDGADHFFRDLYADEVVETVIEFIEE